MQARNLADEQVGETVPESTWLYSRHTDAVRPLRTQGAQNIRTMMEALHHKQFAVNGIVGLIEYRAHRRHLRVCEHGVRARLLVLKPVAYALAMVVSNRVADVVGKAA